MEYENTRLDNYSTKQKSHPVKPSGLVLYQLNSLIITSDSTYDSNYIGCSDSDCFSIASRRDRSGYDLATAYDPCHDHGLCHDPCRDPYPIVCLYGPVCHHHL